MAKDRSFALTTIPALALGLALAAGLPAGAEILEVELAVDPGAPTWREPIEVEITGVANCAVSVRDTRTFFEAGTGLILEVEVSEACIIDPPVSVPFTVTAEFPPFNPTGPHTLRLTEEEVGTLTEMPLTVYSQADLLIEPAAPATDAEPFTFTLTAPFPGCVDPEPARVEGDVIVASFPEECPFLPPGPLVRTYDYTVGPLAAGDYTIRAFQPRTFPPGVATLPLRVYAADGCVPSDTVLCLRDRFRAEVEWTNFRGVSGKGTAVPLEGREDTGLFWFFHPANLELTVKVVKGCGLNDRYWVFVSSGSTVEYEITVTDTASDETRVYRNELGETPSLIADTGAFATCGVPGH